jgi:hypothetical protein
MVTTWLENLIKDKNSFPHFKAVIPKLCVAIHSSQENLLCHENCQNFPFQTVKILLSKLSKISFPNCQKFPFQTVKIFLFKTVKIFFFKLSKFTFPHSQNFPFPKCLKRKLFGVSQNFWFLISVSRLKNFGKLCFKET